MKPDSPNGTLNIELTVVGSGKAFPHRLHYVASLTATWEERTLEYKCQICIQAWLYSHYPSCSTLRCSHPPCLELQSVMTFGNDNHEGLIPLCSKHHNHYLPHYFLVRCESTLFLGAMYSCTSEYVQFILSASLDEKIFMLVAEHLCA